METSIRTPNGMSFTFDDENWLTISLGKNHEKKDILLQKWELDELKKWFAELDYNYKENK